MLIYLNEPLKYLCRSLLSSEHHFNKPEIVEDTSGLCGLTFDTTDMSFLAMNVKFRCFNNETLDADDNAIKTVNLCIKS